MRYTLFALIVLALFVLIFWLLGCLITNGISDFIGWLFQWL